MKINREQLVELLVDKTGMQQEQVEEQLAVLINRVHEASDEGKKFEIKDFGTFSMREGQLQFTPSEKLKTEINNKYAGMEPIELISSYQDADEDEPQKDRSELQEEQEEEKPVVDFEGEPEEEEAPVQETSEQEVEEEPEEVEAREQEETDPFADLEEESGEEDEVPEPEEQEPEPEEDEPEREGIIWGLDEGTEDEEEEEKPVVDFEGEPEEEEAPVQETSEQEVEEEPEEVEAREQEETDPFADLEEESDEEDEAPEPVTAKPKKDLRNIGHRRDRKNSSTMTILVAAASIIIIAISVWLAYDLGVFTDSGSAPTAGEDGETEQQVASATQQNNLPAASQDEAGQPDNQQPGGNTETPEEPAGQQQAESGAQQQMEPDTENEVANEGDDKSANSDYGLKGSLTPAGNDGYTLIVLSMRYEDRSREVYRDLKQQGYRTLIVSAMVNGDTYWRVGVGQFKTIENAQQASQNLPEPYRNNYFVKRIQ